MSYCAAVGSHTIFQVEPTLTEDFMRSGGVAAGSPSTVTDQSRRSRGRRALECFSLCIVLKEAGIGVWKLLGERGR